ncbi:MAG: TetR/AcrR family transcriptional regulator [Acidimicrobiales bacterium]|nr:TetR/AcrR family transcriptional regulator [Acidimicrobiales bacterium]
MGYVEVPTMNQNAAQEIETSERILDVAERLVQTRGFNGFSYAHIAAELELTKPALHYHFPNKAEMVRSLVARYTERFDRSLADIDALRLDSRGMLANYTQIYVDVVRSGRMCLCGMLAAEYQTLPSAVQQAVMEFFDRNETWLAHVLDDGRLDGSLRFEGQTSEIARFVLSELEGAMLLARLHNDSEQFEGAVGRLLAGFTAVLKT